MADPYELPRLLARFKLQVRRLLNQTVDLEKLARDSDYARLRLAEVEDQADDEELLVMVLRLRDQLNLVTPAPPAVVEAPAPLPVPDMVPPQPARNYRFGARSW